MVIKTTKSQSGAAMVMVLLISAILGVLVTVVSYQSRMLIKEQKLQNDYFLAKKAVDTSQAILLQKLLTSPIWLLGVTESRLERVDLPLDLNFFGAEFTFEGVQVTLQDQSGLLSLIPTDRKSLRRVLLSNGISEKDTNIAVDSILDWMDKDDFQRLNGAEAMDYNVTGFPRNDHIQHISELRNIKGVSGQVFEIIKDNAALFGAGTPITKYAPSHLLASLYGVERKKVGEDSELNVKKSVSNEEDAYPSRRLTMSLSAKVGHSQYNRHFTIVRGMATARPFFIAEYQVGN